MGPYGKWNKKMHIKQVLGSLVLLEVPLFVALANFVQFSLMYTDI